MVTALLLVIEPFLMRRLHLMLIVVPLPLVLLVIVPFLVSLHGTRHLGMYSPLYLSLLLHRKVTFLLVNLSLHHSFLLVCLSVMFSCQWS